MLTNYRYFNHDIRLHIKGTIGSEKQRCNVQIRIQETKNENVDEFPKLVLTGTLERQPHPQNFTPKWGAQWQSPSQNLAGTWE